MMNPIAVVLHDLTASLQIAQTLLARINNNQEPASSGLELFADSIPSRHQQRNDARRIVSDTRTADALFRNTQGQLFQIRKYDITVRHKYIYLVVTFPKLTNHIQGIVYIDVLCACLKKPVPAEFRTLLLVIRGRGNLCQCRQKLHGLLSCIAYIIHHFLA